MQTLFGKTLSEIQDICTENKWPKFTAKQIANWLYKKGVQHIDEMTNLSLSVRQQLNETYIVGRYQPLMEQKSIDGTKKYLYRIVSGQAIEAVMIPDEDRATLCVSSQAGCKMGCKFCMTGRQGFQANLTSGEILNQMQSLPEYDQLTNIVFMGMGEPLDNIDNLLKALEILTSDYGYAWSPKRITVSTIGVKDNLERFLKESKCSLAVSLHNPFDEERRSLMPMQKAYPLADTLATIRKFDFSHQRRVSFEYIVFNELNDTERHAKELVKILSGIPCRMNLIRFHQLPDSTLMPSPTERINQFWRYLYDHGLLTTLRASRGEDIFAACGMLSTKEGQKKE